MVGFFIWSILMIFIGVCAGYVIGLVNDNFYTDCKGNNQKL